MGSPPPPPRIWFRSSDLPLTRWMQPRRRPAPPLHLPTPLRSHLLHKLRPILQDSLTLGVAVYPLSLIHGSSSSSAAEAVPLPVLFVALVLWGGGGLRVIKFSSGDWIIGAGETGALMYAVCKLVLCVQTVATSPIISHKNTTPPPFPHYVPLGREVLTQTNILRRTC